MKQEPTVTINGKQLTDAQATTLRFAITDFQRQMAGWSPPGEDEHGQRLSAAYRARADEIVSMFQAVAK